MHKYIFYKNSVDIILTYAGRNCPSKSQIQPGHMFQVRYAPSFGKSPDMISIIGKVI